MVTLEKPTTVAVNDDNIMGEMPREILRRENYLMIGKAATAQMQSRNMEKFKVTV